MNVGSVFPAAPVALAEPPFLISRPPSALARPLVFASPHSGRLYPPEMMAASRLDALSIRRSEDAFVDDLIAAGTDYGASIIAATHARAYIDVNREPYELDQGMFEDELPLHARGRTARVAAGLGSVARVVAEGYEIYARKLTFAEADQRIETIHRPYHAALAGLVDQARATFGAAVLIDWHSMPAVAAQGLGGASCDVVLGDRFGAACAPHLTDVVEAIFRALGYRVSRNAPYAGGFTTEFYGRPAERTHVLQIEISRALYLDEASLEIHDGFERLRRDLESVFAELAQAASEIARSA
ncbi:MAG: N-formylglutamate amidohydrolase [Caulobacteraceae bacterium]|nr:N-formylglutamate amidohydrolase [Caulobacteraceae bacterium]